MSSESRTETKRPIKTVTALVEEEDMAEADDLMFLLPPSERHLTLEEVVKLLENDEEKDFDVLPCIKLGGRVYNKNNLGKGVFEKLWMLYVDRQVHRNFFQATSSIHRYWVSSSFSGKGISDDRKPSASTSSDFSPKDGSFASRQNDSNEKKKNREEDRTPDDTHVTPTTSIKRGRGRPLGSKNRVKQR